MDVTEKLTLKGGLIMSVGQEKNILKSPLCAIKKGLSLEKNCYPGRILCHLGKS